MKKRNKTALIAALSTAGAVSFLTISLARTVADSITAKKLPLAVLPFQNKISGSEINTEFASKVISEADRLLGQPSETVVITNREGLNLTGHLYTVPDAKRIIIAMHGWRSGYSIDYGILFEFLKESGCNVLFPDQRAHGDSGGEYIGFGVLERFDCVDWIKYVVNRFGSDIPIYLLGVSMGATTVLMTSSLNLPSSIRGIISDCAFTSPEAIWRHVIDNNLHVKSRIVYPLTMYMINKKAGFSHTVSTLDSVCKTKIPILFIHGEKDNFVPVDMTYQNYCVCASPKYILTVKDADHGMSYFTDPDSYRKAVVSFFERYDLM